MLPSILISAITCVLMILAILFFPKLRLGRFSLNSYWLVTLGGAFLMLLLGFVAPNKVGAALIADTAVNPVKILILFISMTVLSVFLDELGFFRYLATKALCFAHDGQLRLFIILYLTVSVLTVFTSNDVIILSFTPFICYFSKSAKINPIPYLAAEFVAANTWSMALVIGNPTNIYLATSAGIDFLNYLKVMFLPTLFAGTVSFFALYILYRKTLQAKMKVESHQEIIQDKFLLTIGIAHLGVCTVFLAVSSYLGIEMWIVSAIAVVSLFLCVLVVSVLRFLKVQKEGTKGTLLPSQLKSCLKRAPWELIPFVLSMFVMIIALGEAGVTSAISSLLGNQAPIASYGIVSFLAANLVNNIPMSVLFSGVIPAVSPITEAAVYATIIGSNIGAFMTPIGALAGIMWSSILAKHGYRFGYFDFLKLGVTVAVPTLLAALLGLFIIL